jgi:hypothetical protein
MVSLQRAASTAFDTLSSVRARLQHAYDAPNVFDRAAKGTEPYAALAKQARAGADELKRFTSLPAIQKAVDDAAWGVEHLHDIGRGLASFQGDRVLMTHAIGMIDDSLAVLDVARSVPNKAAARERLRELLQTPPESMTRQDHWQIRALLYDMPKQVRIEPPARSDAIDPLDDLLTDLDETGKLELYPALIQLRSQLEYGTPQLAKARLLEILERSHDDLTHRDLIEIRELAQRVPSVRRSLDKTLFDNAIALDVQYASSAEHADMLQYLTGLRLALRYPRTTDQAALTQQILSRAPHEVPANDLRALAMLTAARQPHPSLARIVAGAGSDWDAILNGPARISSWDRDVIIADSATYHLSEDPVRGLAVLNDTTFVGPLDKFAMRKWLALERDHTSSIGKGALAQLGTVLDSHIAHEGGDGRQLGITVDLLEHIKHSAREAAREGDSTAQSIAQKIVRTVNRNLQRIDGTKSDGYANFPDYGELGQLSADARVLASLVSPQPAAPVRTNAVSW